MLRPKYVIFALIALMMGYLLVHNERFLIEPGNPGRAVTAASV